MADNVDLASPSGTCLADEVTDGTLGTGVAQFAKIMDGALGSTNKLTVDAGGAAQVSVPPKWVDVTPTLDTSAYASGDTLFGATSIANAFRLTDGTGKLVSVCIIDKDKQLQAIDLLFFDANVSMGTSNVACAISDADADNCMGVVRVAVGDWVDVGGAAVASLVAGFGVHAVSGGTNMYVAAVARGAPTHTSSGLVVRVHVDAD